MADGINICFLVIVGLTMLSGVSAHSSGAPSEACSDMRPQHIETEPSLLPAPFTITVSSTQFTAQHPVRVTIKMDAGKTFTGFLLKSSCVDHCATKGSSVGRFTAVQDTEHTCNQMALTHTAEFSRQRHSELTVEWTYSSFNPVSVQFRATVVVDYDAYWVDERSPIIYESKLTPPTVQPTTTGRPFSTDMTDGCGKSKGCYRNPPQCAEEACDVVVTWLKHSDRVFEFEMSADTDGWVALGLSDDKFMGDDEVMECLNPSSSESGAKLRLSENKGKHNELVKLSRQSDLELIDISHSQGRLRCHFKRTIPRTRGSSSKLLSGSPVHLMMAKGLLDDDGTKKLRHSLEPNKYPYISPSTVNLEDKVDITDTARYPLVKAHGCLLLVAWMMCASTALLLAKYYKRMWPNNSLCGVEVWFAVHRALMIVCLILTAIAFILIFIHVGGYSHMPDYADKAHPPLGICVMILVILNPFITLFRCKPDSRYRPIFNWFHWLFGTVAYVLMLPAVLIGLNLHKAFVPSWSTWIITAFFLFHLIIELMLEIHGCLNARKQQRRDDDFERTKKMDFKGEYHGVEEPVGHRFKKIVLTVYLVVVIILGVIMVIAVAAG